MEKKCFNPIVCYDDWIVIVWRVSPNRLHSRRIVLIFQSRRDLLMFFDDQEGGKKSAFLACTPRVQQIMAFKAWTIFYSGYGILLSSTSCLTCRFCGLFAGTLMDWFYVLSAINGSCSGFYNYFQFTYESESKSIQKSYIIRHFSFSSFFCSFFLSFYAVILLVRFLVQMN